MRDDHDNIRLLLMGLAAGDALGATSEFIPQGKLPQVYAEHADQGWPFRYVGGGSFNWQAGAPTDDTQMAMCILRSFLDLGRFDGEGIARHFHEWLLSDPPDIGGTTMRTLREIGRGAPWHRAGLEEYCRSPDNAANGSLMRNGIIPALSSDTGELYRMTIHHGIVTHYAPLPVLCCLVQNRIIHDLISDRGDGALDPHVFRSELDHFFSCTGDLVCREWRANVDDRYVPAWETLIEGLDPAREFNPFGNDFTGRSGYCLLTLQIGLWAMRVAQGCLTLTPPPGWPQEPFMRPGGWTLSAVAMIGHDADTYGAVAGPMIVAACGLPGEYEEGLWALRELDELLPGEQGKS